MKKGVILVLTLLVPCFLLLEVWEVFRYNALRADVARFEQEQADWLDRNTKAVLGIAFYSSPERIDKIVHNDTGYEKADESKIVRIEFADTEDKN
jgi:hypothetical protein